MARQVTELETILEVLNPAQREAVLHERGPLLILAGAGSGKTRTVTHRMACLMLRGVPPESILAITFTNKAASEMKERMERLCGLQSPWVSTFHSFCARLLRRHIHRVEPYDNSFTIYDADDSRALLKEVLEEDGVDRAVWTPRAAQEEISRIKNRTVGEAETAFRADFLHGQVLRRIYHLYVERLRERNALDFDDLLLLTVRLFEEQDDVLERYQRQFQHVLVDEYQDTNAIQYRIGRLLSAGHRNICITGDPDQSIYAWRGADVTNILNFERDYPDARVILLEQNYRSTHNVLHVANALISHNSQRKQKSLWSANPVGEPVRVYRFVDENEEAAEIAQLIEGLRDEGVPPGGIAVLYRINALSRPLEQAFIYSNLPYDIVGGIAYFLRKEVKDILAYLRVIDNPRDLESLKRIINVPPRGIGKASLEKLVAAARASGRGVLEWILAGEGGAGLGKKIAAALHGFAALFRDLAELRRRPIAELVTAVIRRTEYEEYLRQSQGDAAREPTENAWELVNAAGEYDRTHPDGTLTGFLEMVNLLGDVDRWQHREDRIALMTLHSAKGLEFPVVLIVGVEDGILPLLSAADPDTDIEEERRLLYVGITRARERLYLTHTASRMRFGSVRAAYPSRFLRELRPPGNAGASETAALEIDAETGDCLDLSPDRRLAGARAGRGTRSPSGEGDEHAGVEDTGWDFDDEPIPVGARVRHDQYGEGIVVRLSGIGRQTRVTIAFDDGNEKQFVFGFAPLRRVR